MRVIYLHGFASSPASLKARFFGEKFRALGVPFLAPALDQGDFPGTTVTAEISLVEKLLMQSEEPVVLCGSSLGGYVAALVASRHPRAVERLVLMAPAFRLHDRWREQMAPGALEKWREEGSATVYHYGDQQDRSIRYQFLVDAQRYEPYPDIRQPALIFHGDQDTVVPVAYSERYVFEHPNVRLIRLPSGHELTDVLDPIWREAEGFLGQRGG